MKIEEFYCAEAVVEKFKKRLERTRSLPTAGGQQRKLEK